MDLVLFTMWVYAPLVSPPLRARLDTDLIFTFMTFFGIVFLYIGLHLPLWKKAPPFPQLQYAAPFLSQRWFKLAFLVFCLATLLLVYEAMRVSGVGIIGLLTGDRLSAVAARLNGSNEGSIPYRLMAMTQPILLVWLAINLGLRRWRQAAVLYTVLLISIVLIATTRLPVILTLLSPLVYFARKHGRSLSLPVSLGAAATFLILMYALNIVRGQGLDKLLSDGFSVPQVLGSVAANFAPMRGYEILWQLDEQHALQYEYGLTYLYVPLTAIPRTLWPTKPLTSIEARWTTSIFGQHFAFSDEGVGVWTFTAWGEGLVQFGIPGVLVNLFLYGVLVALVESKFGTNQVYSLVWFYYSVMAAIYLRSSLSALAWTTLETFLPLMVVLYLSLHTRHRRRHRHTLHDQILSARKVTPQ